MALKNYLIFSFFLVLSLFCCKGRSPERLQILTNQLSSSDPKVRNASALEIANYKSDGATAVPELIALLNRDKNRGIRTSAAVALRAIGTKDAIAALDNYRE